MQRADVLTYMTTKLLPLQVDKLVPSVLVGFVRWLIESGVLAEAVQRSLRVIRLHSPAIPIDPGAIEIVLESNIG